MTKNNSKLCGIYMIKNIKNNKVYIGQSVDIKSRWTCHKSDFNLGRHSNPHFQRAWDKYGKSNFKFSIIEFCDKEDLDRQEIYYIELFRSNNPQFGYNAEIGGSSKKLSEYAKERLRTKEKVKLIGVENPAAKLTTVQVVEIKKLLFEGELTFKEIANLYNIYPSGVTKIRNGKTYKNIVTPYDDIIINKLSDKAMKYMNKLTKEQVSEIKQLLVENNMTQVAIAKKYNVNRTIIVNIKNLRHWADVEPQLNEILKSQDNKNGSGNKKSIISEDVVIKIKEMLYNKKSPRTISEIFNISIGLVHDIKKGRSWTHVITPYDNDIKNIKSEDCDKKHKKFSEENIVNIKKLFVYDNKSIMEIAEILNTSRGTIRQILYGKIYNNIGTIYDKDVDIILKNRYKLKDHIPNIRKLISEGKTNKEISEIYKIDPSTISNIRNNKTYKNDALNI